MTITNLLFPAILALSQATAVADGGTVLFRDETGRLAVTVFASPSPLSAGPVDISLLLQNQNGLEPVLDAEVSLLLRAESSGVEIRAHATREQARNKLLYAAPVTLESGKWLVEAAVLRNGERAEARGVIDVAPTPEMAMSYLSYIAFPLSMTAGFVFRERLIRRKLKGRA